MFLLTKMQNVNHKAISQKYCLQTVPQNGYGINVSITTKREQTCSQNELS